MNTYLIFIRHSIFRDLINKNIFIPYNKDTYNKLNVNDIIFIYVKYDYNIYKKSFKIIEKNENSFNLEINEEYNKNLDFKENKKLFENLIKNNLLNKSISSIEYIKINNEEINTIIEYLS